MKWCLGIMVSKIEFAIWPYRMGVRFTRQEVLQVSSVKSTMLIVLRNCWWHWSWSLIYNVLTLSFSTFIPSRFLLDLPSFLFFFFPSNSLLSSFRPSVRLSTCLSVCLTVCLSVRLSVYWSVYPLPVCLSVCLSVYLYVYLSVCLSENWTISVSSDR